MYFDSSHTYNDDDEEIEEDEEEEEDLHAQLRKDLEAIESLPYGEEDDEQSTMGQSLPDQQAYCSDSPFIQLDHSNGTSEVIPKTDDDSLWQDFLGTASEAEARFASIQNTVNECHALLSHPEDDKERYQQQRQQRALCVDEEPVESCQHQDHDNPTSSPHHQKKEQEHEEGPSSLDSTGSEDKEEEVYSALMLATSGSNTMEDKTEEEQEEKEKSKLMQALEEMVPNLDDAMKKALALCFDAEYQGGKNVVIQQQQVQPSPMGEEKEQDNYQHELIVVPPPSSSSQPSSIKLGDDDDVSPSKIRESKKTMQSYAPSSPSPSARLGRRLAHFKAPYPISPNRIDKEEGISGIRFDKAEEQQQQQQQQQQQRQRSRNVTDLYSKHMDADEGISGTSFDKAEEQQQQQQQQQQRQQPSNVADLYIKAQEKEQQERLRQAQDAAMDLEKRLREEEESLARARQAEKRAADERRKRRVERADRLLKEGAVTTIASVWRGAIARLSRWRLTKERRQELAKQEEEKRQIETLSAQRERDRMGREEKYMRSMLEKEARLAQTERRRMAEEERWMKLYIRSLALERERKGFETRRMEVEDRLGLKLRQQEEDRVRAMQAQRRARFEAEERIRMIREDELSAALHILWKQEYEERGEAKVQRDLALSLIVMPDTAASAAADPSERRHQQQPPASRGASCIKDDSYGHQRWKEWISSLRSQSSRTASATRRQPTSSRRTLSRPNSNRKKQKGEGAALTKSQLLSYGNLSTLTRLELCVEGLADVSVLGQCCSLQSLFLNVNRLETLESLSKISSVVELAVKDNDLVSLAGIEVLCNLQELVLDINQLQSLEGIESCPSLRVLSANTNSIRHFPDPPSTIQKLCLYHNHISSIPDDALQSLTTLTSLNLGRNRLTGLDGTCLSACPSLVSLILSQNQLQTPPSPLHLPLLQELWLGGNQITTLESWNAGASSSSSTDIKGMWLPSLRTLFLQDNAITSEGLAPGVFAGCPSLEVFELSFNHLSDLRSCVGIIAQCCPRLHDIQLHDNPLAREEGYVQALLVNFPRLVEYDGNVIQDDQRWFANSQALSSHGHMIVPVLQELAKRNEMPRSVYSNDMDIWRRAPRRLPCCHCGNELLITPTSAQASSSSASTGPGGQEEQIIYENHRREEKAGRGGRAITCSRCNSTSRFMDLTKANPGAIDWAEVLCWHQYDASKRCSVGLDTNERISSTDRHLRQLCDEGVRLWIGLQCRLHQRQQQQLSQPQQQQQKDLLVSKIEGWNRVQGYVSERLAKLRDLRNRVRTFGDMDEQQAQEEWTAVKYFDMATSVLTETEQATRFQAIWRGYKYRRRQEIQQRNSATTSQSADHRSATPGSVAAAATDVQEAAVTRVQSTFRGFHVRKALQAALDSAKYLDQELDLQGLEGLDFDAFIAPPPELQSNWDTPPISILRGRRRVVPLEEPKPHTTAAFMPSIPSPSTTTSSIRTMECRITPSRATPSSSFPTHESDDAASYFPLSTPNSVNLNHTTMMTTPAGCNSPAARSEPNDLHSLRGGDDGLGLTPAKHEREVLQDWGIQDERLAKTLLRRASRIKKLQGKQGIRENLKDSQYRYQMFMKQSFGGNHQAAPVFAARRGGEGHHHRRFGGARSIPSTTFVIGRGGSRENNSNSDHQEIKSAWAPAGGEREGGPSIGNEGKRR